jgi:exodeoxyribonuclease VII large subunit
MRILAVSDVTRYIADLIRANSALSNLWISGEIANLSRSTTGHYYFSLREGQSQLRCVLFQSTAQGLATRPQPGAAVVVYGNVMFYEPSGSLDLRVNLLYPQGVGVAQLQLDALRLKLQAEGLFATERKRPLPQFPRRIGLVTSPGGAVLHDVLQILGRRYPLAEVLLASASVQGERAVEELCAALSDLARYHESGRKIDVVILARGGGDEKDLAVFNDERLARAVYGCPVPVVSAIGHETDFTIVDEVADVRAPTPSAAAELVAPDLSQVRDLVAELTRRAEQAAQRCLGKASYDLDLARGRLVRRSPSVDVARGRAELEALLGQGLQKLRQRIGLAREQVSGRALQLAALSPERTLDRGYAICTLESGQVLRSIYQAEVGDQMNVRVVDGVVAGRATGRRPGAAQHTYPAGSVESGQPPADSRQRIEQSDSREEQNGARATNV